MSAARPCRKSEIYLFVIMGALALGFCAPARGVVGVVQRATAAKTNRIKILKDISYGEQKSSLQSLDLYLPQDLTHKPFSLFVFIHGGAWVSGDKSGYENIGRAFATQGVAVATINYRLSGAGIVHPAHVNDGARSLHWLRQHAHDYNINEQRIFVGGHSAGAHMSALLALDPHYLNQVSEKPANFRGFIGLEGIYDLPRLVKKFPAYEAQFIAAAFGSDHQQWAAASPALMKINSGSPWLVVQSDADELVDAAQSDTFIEKLKGSHTNLNAVKVKAMNHFAVVEDIGAPGNIVTEKIVEFINKN